METEAIGTHVASTTVDSAVDCLNDLDAATGKSPLRTPELLAAVRKLITRPSDQDPKAPKPWIDRGKLADFLEKYYKIDKVTKEFWAAFTGFNKDAIIDGDRLKYCLKMFETYRKWTGHTLEYMAASSKVYVVPAEKLEAWLKQNFPGGIEDLLRKTKDNPEVEKIWNSAKYLTGNLEGKYKDDTYRWFAIMLAVTFADKLTDDKLNEARDLNDLDLGHGLVAESYNKYLLRWMMGEDDKGEKICYGISKDEWKTLLAQQKAIKKIGNKYCNNEYALTDIKLPNALAEQRLAEAIALFNADSTGNKEKVLGLIRDLRNPVKAAPVPPSPLLAQLKEAAKVEAP